MTRGYYYHCCRMRRSSWPWCMVSTARFCMGSYSRLIDKSFVKVVFMLVRGSRRSKCFFLVQGTRDLSTPSSSTQPPRHSPTRLMVLLLSYSLHLIYLNIMLACSHICWFALVHLHLSSFMCPGHKPSS